MQDFDQDQKQNAENAFNQKNLKMIMKIYSDALNQQNQKSFQLTELHFSYLTLLSTLNLNSCSSYCSILNIQSNIKLRLGWKDKQKLVTILKLANFQSYLNQIRMKKENEFQLYHILQFEDEMNVIQKQYFECMKQYKIVVEKLSMSYIEINEIFLLLKSYREERGNLEQKIKAQLQYNSNSEILKNLCINFDFYMLHNQSLLRFYEKQSRKSILLLKNKEYYSKQSCFVYISLLEKSFSLIQKVNKAFVQAFGFANKSFILNKSILQLFPNNFLKKSSEKLLSQIITENFLSLYNQSINIPLFIGKNSLGYAIPLQLKVQSQIVNQNDFGITVWAKPIKDDNLYILLDFKDHSLIKVASKIFCDEFMYDNFTLNCLKTLRMDSLIPIIDDLIRLSSIEIGKKFETLLIQPLDKEQAQQKPNIKDPYFLNYLKFQDLFLVTLQIHSFDFKLTQFVRVVIENYEPIYNYKDKIQHIQMYQIQIKELTGVSLDFDPSIELENLVDNRAKSINFENSSYKNRIFKYKTRKESNLNINESTAEMLDQSSSQIQQSQIHNQQYKQNQKPSQYQTKDYNLTNEASNLNNSQIPLDQNQDIFMIHSIQEQPIQYIQENQINQQNLNKFVKNEKDYYNSHQNLIANQVDSSLYIGNSMFNNNLQQDCQLTKDESYYMNFNEHQQSNEALQAFNKKYQASKFEQISMIQEDNLELNSKNTCIVQDTDNNKKGFKEQNFKQYSNSQLLSSKNALQFNGVNRQRISSKNEEKIKLQKHETNQESENILPCDENKIQKKQDIQSVSSSSKSVKNKQLLLLLLYFFVIKHFSFLFSFSF